MPTPPEPAPAVAAILDTMPQPLRDAAIALRHRLHALIPDASDTLAYGKPAVACPAGAVVAYGATGPDIVVYLLDGTSTTQRAGLLAGWKTTKGSVRYPPANPIPDSILAVLIADRLVARGCPN
jgi:uncharacterized protein YdhG (YjbR/CyaY superfamily)